MSDEVSVMVSFTCRAHLDSCINDAIMSWYNFMGHPLDPEEDGVHHCSASTCKAYAVLMISEIPKPVMDFIRDSSDDPVPTSDWSRDFRP